jgi:hypothetical protein
LIVSRVIFWNIGQTNIATGASSRYAYGNLSKDHDMLKKSLIVQTLLLLTGIALGMALLGAFSPELKMVHATVGALIGLVSLMSVYCAFREKVAASLLMLVIVAAVLAIMAFIGGKLTATNYNLGLMLMRGAAIAALLVTGFSAYKAPSTKSK